MPSLSPGSLLRNANFVKLWVGQSVSELGSQITNLAMPLTAVIVLHAKTFEVGALEAALMLPFLLFGLPAGAIVDRMRMRRVLIVSDAARMLVLGSIPVAAAFGDLTLLQLFIVAFVAGVLTVFFDVAYQSYLPSLIERADLTDANAKLTSTTQIASVAGPALGGALVSAVGAATAIAADAASYLVSVISLIAIRAPDIKPEVSSGPIFRTLAGEIREGVHFVFRQPMLRMIAGCTGAANLATGIGFAVLTVYMVRSLHMSPALIGVMFAIGGVAGLVGALVTTRVIRWIGVGWTVIVGAIGSCFGGVALALSTPGGGIWWIAAGLSLISLFGIVYNVAQVSLRQALTPPRLLGRMNATMRFLVWGTVPIGALIGGALGTTIGLRPTLWIAAGLGFIPPLFVIFSPVRKQQTIPSDHVEADIEPSAIGPLPKMSG